MNCKVESRDTEGTVSTFKMDVVQVMSNATEVESLIVYKAVDSQTGAC